MSHSHNNTWRPRRFRVFVTNKYYENRDEYDGYLQVQPYTFEEFVSMNLKELKESFRLTLRK